MAQYCDSKELERNWYNWLLASQVPLLEDYRRLGLLWTRVIEYSRDAAGQPISVEGQHFFNPVFPIRVHCIALAEPIHLVSYQGASQRIGTTVSDSGCSRIVLRNLPDELNLLSGHWVHRLETDPYAIQVRVLPELRKQGYTKEVPAKISWHAMLGDINRMCTGISTRFNMKSEDEQSDLANEALSQVMQKLIKYKLVYIPGKAPVFNLLTTTIYRCMYSILNRKNNQRDGLSQLLQDAEAGVLPDNRSLRVQTHKRIKSRC